MKNPIIEVVPVAVKSRAYTRGPNLDPKRFTQAVGNVEKCPPRQKKDKHTDIM